MAELAAVRPTLAPTATRPDRTVRFPGLCAATDLPTAAGSGVRPPTARFTELHLLRLRNKPMLISSRSGLSRASWTRA